MRPSQCSFSLVLPEGGLTAWQAESIRLASLAAPLLGVIRLVNAPTLPKKPWTGPALAWARLDRMCFGKKPDAFARVSRPSPDAPPTRDLDLARPLESGEARDLIGGAEIILSLAGTPLPQALAQAAPLGVLSFTHHDPRLGAIPQTWSAFLRREEGFEHGLVWNRPGLGERLAVRTRTPVSPLYLFDTANQACHKAALFPARFFERLKLHERPEDAWDSLRSSDAALPTPPCLIETLGMGAVFLGRHASAAFKDLFYRRQWFLAARPTQNGAPKPPHKDDYAGFAPVELPKNAGWADPFPFSHGGRDYVFFETIPMDTGKGAIAVCPVTPSGSLGEARTVLEKDYHLSYPFVFEWEDEVFMMPESNAGRTLDVYRAVNFPYDWEPYRNILSGERITDATIHQDEKTPGRFWLFANKSVPGASNWDELFLFHGPSPLGPWTPHPQNPVVSDARFARPGGRLISFEGRLFRPAQDCVPSYGKRLHLMEVTALDPERFEERLAATLDPGLIPGSAKLHTLNAGRSMEFVDGFRLLSRLTGKPARFEDL